MSTTQDDPRFGGLADQFEELAKLLRSSTRTPLSAEQVTRFLQSAVPHGDHCGLTLLRSDGSAESVATTGDVPLAVDALQYSLGEGPCLTAAASGAPVVVEDLETDDRWPVFGPKCVAETGIRSMSSVALVLEGEERAAASFYAGAPGAFDERDTAVANAFAPLVAVVLQSHVSRRQVENLEQALTSSRKIGTAIGILMARQLLTSDEAFGQLRGASQHLNRKLRDVAEVVTMTGELPRVER